MAITQSCTLLHHEVSRLIIHNCKGQVRKVDIVHVTRLNPLLTLNPDGYSFEKACLVCVKISTLDKIPTLSLSSLNHECDGQFSVLPQIPTWTFPCKCNVDKQDGSQNSQKDSDKWFSWISRHLMRSFKGYNATEILAFKYTSVKLDSCEAPGWMWLFSKWLRLSWIIKSELQLQADWNRVT